MVTILGRFRVLENTKHINRHIKMHQTVTAIEFIQDKKITVRSFIELCGTDNFLGYPLNPWYFHERLGYRHRIEKSQVST